MVRLLVALVVLSSLAGCSTAERTEPPPPTSSSVRALVKIAEQPAVDLTVGWPAAPRGFTNAERDHLAGMLVTAARQVSAPATGHPTLTEAIGHTFAHVDMRSRRDFLATAQRASRRYDDIDLAWMFVDLYEPASKPSRPSRIVRAAWDADRRYGRLELRLQTTYASITARGEPMFVRRTFEVASSDPLGGPAVPVSLGAGADVPTVDRCHLVKTGLMRPELREKKLARAAKLLQRDQASSRFRESQSTDFTAGCT